MPIGTMASRVFQLVDFISREEKVAEELGALESEELRGAVRT